jgi:hypothetical protein
MNRADHPIVLVGPEFLAGLITGEGYFGLPVTYTKALKTRQGFIISPRFSLQMNDIDTMMLVVQTLNALDAKPHVRKRGSGLRIDINSGKQVRRLLDYVGPHLTCKKKEAADAVSRFIALRTAHPRSYTYGAEEFRLVDELRAINAGNGKRHVETPEAVRRAAEKAKRTRNTGSMVWQMFGKPRRELTTEEHRAYVKACKELKADGRDATSKIESR